MKRVNYKLTWVVVDVDDDVIVAVDDDVIVDVDDDVIVDVIVDDNDVDDVDVAIVVVDVVWEHICKLLCTHSECYSICTATWISWGLWTLSFHLSPVLLTQQSRDNRTLLRTTAPLTTGENRCQLNSPLNCQSCPCSTVVHSWPPSLFSPPLCDCIWSFLCDIITAIYKSEDCLKFVFTSLVPRSPTIQLKYFVVIVVWFFCFTVKWSKLEGGKAYLRTKL